MLTLVLFSSNQQRNLLFKQLMRYTRSHRDAESLKCIFVSASPPNSPSSTHVLVAHSLSIPIKHWYEPQIDFGGGGQRNLQTQSFIMSDNWLNNSQPSGKHTLRFSLIIFLYAASLPFLENHYMCKFLSSVYRVRPPPSLAAFQHQPSGPRDRSISRSFVYSVLPQGTRLHLTLVFMWADSLALLKTLYNNKAMTCMGRTIFRSTPY